MRVLVTGASGFIGSHLVARFLERKDEVTACSRTVGEGMTVVDMLSPQEMFALLEETRPELVIHCVGNANVGSSFEDPVRDVLSSAVVLESLLSQIVKAGFFGTRVLFLSSAAVYGNPESLPIREDAELDPLSPYAVHKYMCELACDYYRRRNGLDVRIARIFSAYGPGLRKQLFWDMARKYKATGRLEMFGTGCESRDFIYIDDLVHALELIALADPDADAVYNVASGREETVRVAAEAFAKAVGRSAEIVSFNGVVRKGDPINWCADTGRIERLGFTPRHSIESGIAEYAAWAANELGIDIGGEHKWAF